MTRLDNECKRVGGGREGGRVTIVTAAWHHVLHLQGPLPSRVLAPRVRGHEGPVAEALRGEVVGPERETRAGVCVCVWVGVDLHRRAGWRESVCVCVTVVKENKHKRTPLVFVAA